MATNSTSVRLPDALKADATGYADGLGISLNALIAVALRDYLDARTARPGRSVPSPAVPPVDALRLEAGAPAPGAPAARMAPEQSAELARLRSHKHLTRTQRRELERLQGIERQAAQAK
jgi:hypothetical protein